MPEVEYAINNTVNRSTGKSPSQLIFGIEQRGPCTDHLKDFLKTTVDRDLSVTKRLLASLIFHSNAKKETMTVDTKHLENTKRAT